MPNFRQKKYSSFLFLLLCIPVFFSSPAQGHRLIVKAYADGDSIYARGYMEDGSACRYSAALLKNSADETLVQGVTNSEGHCVFPKPQESDLKVVIFGDMGHRGESPVTITQIHSSQTTDHPEVSEIVDQKLAPLVAAVEQLQYAQEQTKIRDIIGGIGYIMGLVGIALYISNKKGHK